MTISAPVLRISAATAALSIASTACPSNVPGTFIAFFSWTEAMIASHFALVREAIGFSADRGDSVNLMNASFTPPKADDTQMAWWKSPETQDWAKTLAWPLGMVLLGLILFLGMVRPAIKIMKNPPPEVPALPDNSQMLATVVDDDTERPTVAAVTHNDGGLHLETLRLEDAKRLAKENPVAVANIIKGWVNGDSPAMGGGGLKGPGV